MAEMFKRLLTIYVVVSRVYFFLIAFYSSVAMQHYNCKAKRKVAEN